MAEMLPSFVAGAWYTSRDEGVVVVDATTADPVARVSSGGLDTRALVDHARRVGGPALRRLNFHERAAALKALATHLDSRNSEYYELSTSTGATRRDSAGTFGGDIFESGLRAERSVQLVCCGLGDLLGHFGGQDVIAFTGSASTAAVLRSND